MKKENTLPYVFAIFQYSTSVSCKGIIYLTLSPFKLIDITNRNEAYLSRRPMKKENTLPYVFAISQYSTSVSWGKTMTNIKSPHSTNSS